MQGAKALYEKLYRINSPKPAEELHRLLTEIRVRHERFDVGLGTPPFERDALNKITAVRVRFTPQRAAQTGPS